MTPAQHPELDPIADASVPGRRILAELVYDQARVASWTLALGGVPHWVIAGAPDIRPSARRYRIEVWPDMAGTAHLVLLRGKVR